MFDKSNRHKGVKMEIRPLYSRIIRKLPLPYPVTLILYGILFLLIGYAIAYSQGIIDIFIYHWPTYIFILATIWVAGVFCWCFDDYYLVLKSLIHEFEIDEDEYEKLLKNHFNYVTSSKNWTFASLPFILIFLVLLWLIRSGINDYTTFEALLSNDLLFIYYIVLMVFGIIELFSGGFLLISMTLFVKKISKISINLKFSPNRRPKITDLTQFSVAASVTWFVGVLLVGIVTVKSADMITVSFSLFTIIIGLSTFLIPQWYIYKAIKKAKDNKLRELGTELNTAYEKFLVDDYPNERFTALISIFDEINKIKENPFSFNQGVTVLGSSLLPVLNLVLKSYI
jgi:hypothetical protein